MIKHYGLSILVLVFAAHVSAGDSVALSSPVLTAPAANAMKEIFAPLAGKSIICPDPSVPWGRICARVLADGTPQTSTSYCTAWSNSIALNDIWNDADRNVSAQVTTTGLIVDYSYCNSFGDNSCATWMFKRTCNMQWQ